MLWLEHKYVGLVSPRLDRFSRVNQNTYRMRCPICGDSQTNKSKTRGYIYLSKGCLRYHCHNCGISMGFPYLIKQLDPNLYYEFIKENMSENRVENPGHAEFVDKLKMSKSMFKTTPLADLKKVSKLPHDHPVKRYVEKRLIPTSYHYKLLYAPKFKQCVNSIVPDKFADTTNDEPRLIIPFLDKERNLIGFQGRSFSKSSALRYITIMLDDESPRIFNLESINAEHPIYVLEGPIDAMFIPNSIATAGGDISTEIELTDLPKDNIIVVYDNEPRNSETVKKISKCIERGYKVCIWPETVKEKDINDMILSGMTADQIKRIIDNGTFSGIEAKLQLTIWKKC